MLGLSRKFELSNSGKVAEIEMRSEWASDEDMQLLLAALMPANRLAIEVSMTTGLRISDVLSITREQAIKGRFTVTEQKTGKHRRVRLTVNQQRRALGQAGQIYVWPNRYDGKRHRTRQAVYKDVVRAAKAFRLTAHITPHSARKIYAVKRYDRTEDIAEVQRDLGHDREATTLVYALAREMTERRHKSLRRGVSGGVKV